MKKINYAIHLERYNKKSKKIEKILNKSISNISNYIYNLIKDFEFHITICNIKLNTNVYGKGCYFLTEENNKTIVNIYIDNKFNHMVKYTFYHEIGHLVDDILGCIKHNVLFTKENANKYHFSQIDEDFIFFNKTENDFFTQIKRNDIDDLTYQDLRESFADCIAEMMIGIKMFYMNNTKSVIYKIIEKENQICNIDYDMVKYV